MRQCCDFVLVLSFTLFTSGIAAGATYTVPAQNRGWFRADGYHVAGEGNYVTGDIGQGLGEYRSFFVFDVSGISLNAGETIDSASLTITTRIVRCVGASETVTFFDVAASPATLASDQPIGSLIGQAVHSDLGSGTVYAEQQYVEADGTDPFATKTIPLNAAALVSLTSTVGSSHFIAGGAVTTLDTLSNNEFAYGASTSGTAAPILTITTVIPEAQSIVIAGAAFLALPQRRRYRVAGAIHVDQP